MFRGLASIQVFQYNLKTLNLSITQIGDTILSINREPGLEDTYVKGFIVDHNFNLTLRRKINYGVGISVVNFRTGFSFENPIGVQRYQSIEFNTYNAFVTFPYKKILFIELKALYVPNGFPENPYEQYIMYSLRVYYKLNFSKSKHPSN